jgi:hypothetical protein
MSGIPIYTLPEKTELDQLDYIPVSSDTQTSKVTPYNFRKNMDKTVSLPTTSSVSADDYIKVDSFTYGTRALRVRNSVIYSAMTSTTAAFNELVLGSDLRMTNARVPLPHSHSITNMTDFDPANYITNSRLGLPNGIAPLDSSSLVPSTYLPPFPITNIPSASGIFSNAVNLISDNNVQGAIDKLSNAAYILINSASAGVTGTTNVQGALGQKLSLLGGSMTGLLVAQANNFRIGANDLIAISNNIGIGTSTPTTKLDVAGNIKGTDFIYVTSNGFPQFVLQDPSGQTNRYAIWRDPSDVLSIGPQTTSGAGTAALSIYRDTQATFSSNLRVVGDITAFYSSDRRLKDNIKNIENPIDKIRKINGVSFDWNDKQSTHTGHDIGVVAQEIESVFPELVTTRDNGYKAVKYEKLVALLIEGIKDLQTQIDELKRDDISRCP